MAIDCKKVNKKRRIAIYYISKLPFKHRKKERKGTYFCEKCYFSLMKIFERNSWEFLKNYFIENTKCLTERARRLLFIERL